MTITDRLIWMTCRVALLQKDDLRFICHLKGRRIYKQNILVRVISCGIVHISIQVDLFKFFISKNKRIFLNLLLKLIALNIKSHALHSQSFIPYLLFIFIKDLKGKGNGQIINVIPY